MEDFKIRHTDNPIPQTKGYYSVDKCGPAQYLMTYGIPHTSMGIQSLFHTYNVNTEIVNELIRSPNTSIFVEH